MSDKRDKQLRKLRSALDEASRAGRTRDAVTAVLELEVLEPREARWPHKRGDLLRKLGSKPECIQAYARAVELYMDQGFLPRAIAMAKVIVQVDPKRTDVLERLDPSAARALHREARPDAVRVDDGVAQRSLDASATWLGLPRSPAIAPLPSPTAAAPHAAPGDGAAASDEVVELELSEVELEDRAPSLATAPAVPEAEQTESDSELASRAEARRLASLPLFPLFAEIPREAMLALAHDSRLRSLADDEVLLRTGDPADALFGILEGQLEVRVPGAGDDTAIRLGEGEVLGESCLLGDEVRRADVVADGAALVLEIPKATLNYLVRIHAGLGEVLLELLTRRLLGNLLRTARPFRGLSGAARKQIATLFGVRRARGGTPLLEAGRPAEALYITLTGHVEVTRGANQPAEVLGAGTLLGQQSVVGGAASEVTVRTRENQLVLVLPQASFSRVAMEHFQVLSEIAELPPVARIAG